MLGRSRRLLCCPYCSKRSILWSDLTAECQVCGYVWEDESDEALERYLERGLREYEDDAVEPNAD